MEYGSIEREIHVEATPEVVFEVVSRPEHIARWWSDDARFAPTPGATGELVWGERTQVAPMSVVDVDPPRLFSFRWCYPGDTADDSTGSLLVTFELTPAGTGTRIRLTETGFRKMGWSVASAQEEHREHISGWDFYLPRLGEYVTRLVSTK